MRETKLNPVALLALENELTTSMDFDDIGEDFTSSKAIQTQPSRCPFHLFCWLSAHLFVSLPAPACLPSHPPVTTSHCLQLFLAFPILLPPH